MGQLFFDEECIYEISKPYLKLVMDGRTDGQAQSNMSPYFFQNWGHKNCPNGSLRRTKGHPKL